MQRRLARLIAVAMACFPAWSGCATQEDSAAVEHAADSAGTGASGGTDAGTSGTAGTTTGGGGVAATGGGGSSTGGSAAAGTSAGTAGSASAAGGDSGMAGAAAGGEGGSAGGCKLPADCDDQNPCTTDNCLQGTCSYTSNNAACATDNDPCTDDVCAVGKCLHTDNKTCECKKDADCNDNEVCTDDKCASNKCTHTNNTAACATDNKACTIDLCAAGKCTHKDDGTCGLGTPFTVDSFNSSVDWMASKTTPDNRLVAVMGINANNLEGNADLWIAEADTGSIEFGLASMVGLGKVRIVIRSAQAGTGNMVFLGTWNGTAWSDKALGGYAAIPTGNYATIEVPTADFNQALDKVTKLRLRFDVTGGEKTWQIDEISVAQ